MTNDPYIEKLRALKPKFKEMNIKRLRVFGSRARGDAQPDSDLDLLVDFIETPGWDYFGLGDELEQELGIPVQIVTMKSIKHPIMQQSILEDATDV